jgi:hypothetical protein
VDNQAKQKSASELLEEAKAKRAIATQERIEKHNAAFVDAYLKALNNADDGASFVEKEIPNLGKCLFTYGKGPQHTEFKRHVNTPGKPLELGPCKTYSCHHAVFPPPKEFKELGEKYNVQAFEIAALAIHKAMQPKDEAEGESSATEA